MYGIENSNSPLVIHVPLEIRFMNRDRYQRDNYDKYQKQVNSRLLSLILEVIDIRSGDTFRGIREYA